MSAPRVELTDRALIVGRQSWPLEQVRLAAAEQQDPNVRVPLMIAAISGVGAVPATIIVIAHSGEGTHGAFAVIACASVAFFVAVFRLLSMDTRYRVVLETSGGPRAVFATSDHELVLSLVARINDRVAPPPRPRPTLAAID